MCVTVCAVHLVIRAANATELETRAFVNFKCPHATPLVFFYAEISIKVNFQYIRVHLSSTSQVVYAAEHGGFFFLLKSANHLTSWILLLQFENSRSEMSGFEVCSLGQRAIWLVAF